MEPSYSIGSVALGEDFPASISLSCLLLAMVAVQVAIIYCLLDGTPRNVVDTKQVVDAIVRLLACLRQHLAESSTVSLQLFACLVVISSCAQSCVFLAVKRIVGWNCTLAFILQNATAGKMYFAAFDILGPTKTLLGFTLFF